MTLSKPTLYGILLNLFAACGTRTPAQTTLPIDSLRIEQVIADVVKNNNRIAAAKYLVQAYQFKEGPAGAWDDPMLTLGVINLPTSRYFNIDPMTMKMIGLSQTIPYTGANGLAKKAARAETKAADADEMTTETEMILAARFAFADAFHRGQTVADLATQFELLGDVVDAAKANVSSNQGGSIELARAQTEYWRVHAGLLEAEHMAEEARYNLNILRGLDANALIPSLAAPTRPNELVTSPDEWLTEAKKNYPPLQKYSYQALAYGFSAKSARRMSWPSLNLSGSYGFRDANLAGSPLSHGSVAVSNSDMLTFEASFSLPIFSGRQQRNTAKSFDALQKSTEEEMNQKWHEVEARLRLLFTTSQHLKEIISLYEDKIVPADQDAFKSAMAGYSANKIQFADLLTLAASIYKDRATLNDYNNQYDRTLAEVASYTTRPGATPVDALLRNIQ